MGGALYTRTLGAAWLHHSNTKMPAKRNEKNVYILIEK